MAFAGKAQARTVTLLPSLFFLISRAKIHHIRMGLGEQPNVSADKLNTFLSGRLVRVAVLHLLKMLQSAPMAALRKLHCDAALLGEGRQRAGNRLMWSQPNTTDTITGSIGEDNKIWFLLI